MIELVNMIFGLLDPALVFWALVLNVLGFFLKRKGLPKACPPLPLLLYLIAFVPCLLLGWLNMRARDGETLMLVLFYAISNAGLVTLPAIFGYDIVHAFTGKKARKCVYKIDLSSPVSDKLRLIVYPSATIVSFAAAMLIAFFVFSETIFYAICFGLFAALLALALSRMILHIIAEDTSAEMYAICIYVILAAFAWLGLIYTESWLFVSIFGAAFVGFLLMAAGTRLLDPVIEENVIAEYTKQGYETDLDFLKRTVRFRFTDDKLGNPPDTNRPICQIGDSMMTCEEAFDAGFGAKAAEGIEYLRMILKKEEI